LYYLSFTVALRTCQVAFTAHTGVTHSVEVEAESLYEAAGLGLARLKKDGWIEGLGPDTRLEITVRTPAALHSVTVKQLQRWVGSVNGSPADTLKKAKVKHLLGY
jgi:hypothetical protein